MCNLAIVEGTSLLIMTSLIDLWLNNKELIISKSIQQVIAFCGDGKLRDGKACSLEFRAYLKSIPSWLLEKYANECLETAFNDSGLALQDIVNQIGTRIGFDVEYGLYQGKRNQIGFDGIWTASDGYSIITEVKTTDAYRINLDVISKYRNASISSGRMTDRSSVLIVVGRQDTGDLEAQIRGSRHAWDIRLISTDAIVNLMKVRENLNDARIIQQISEILKPQEYTRLDRLIDVIFTTAQDVIVVDPDVDEPDSGIEEIDSVLDDKDENKTKKEKKPKFQPVKFHEECIEKIQSYIKKPLVKKSRSTYSNDEKSINIVCSISKRHENKSTIKFWFAYHPYYTDFLKNAQKSFMAYGCGSEDLTVLIPFEIFEPLLQDFWTTENEDKMYWHVIIYEREDGLFLQIPKKNEFMNISKYKI